MNSVTSIINREFTKDKYNILLVMSPDILMDRLLCQTGHNFFSIPKWSGREMWGREIDKPDNLEFFLENPPIYIDFDFIVVHNRTDGYSVGEQLSHNLHIPLVCLNEISAKLFQNSPQFSSIKNRQGHFSVYSDQNILESWGQVGPVIRPGISTVFNKEGKRGERILMLFPRDKKQEEMIKIINKEFPVEFLCGRNEEDLAKQYKECGVFVDINGPEFYLSTI